MMMKSTIIACFLILALSLTAQQQLTVTGNVTEATTGDSGIGVTVLVKGTNNDKSDTPYAVEQAHEVQMLEQMLMQYEARSYQLQVGSRVGQAV